MRNCKSAAMVVLAGAMLGILPGSVNAAVVYSDITSFSGSAYAQGATTAVGNPGVDYSSLVADDITPLAGSAGMAVTSITFSVANFNSTSLSSAPALRFYDSDGTDGGPGTILDALSLNPVSQSAGSVALYTVSSSAPGGFFLLPADGTFWAGVAFTDAAGSTASAAQLANFGQGLFDPPTIGSSQDAFFQSTTTTDFTTSNPVGGFQFFGGDPVANYGWAFSAAAVPEPASLSLGGLLTLGLLSRRRSVAR